MAAVTRGAEPDIGRRLADAADLPSSSLSTAATEAPRIIIGAVNDDLSAGAIAGIAIGATAGALLIGATAVYLVTRCQHTTT